MNWLTGIIHNGLTIVQTKNIELPKKSLNFLSFPKQQKAENFVQIPQLI